MMRGMVIDMNDAQLHTLDQLRAFLNGTVAVGFSVRANERYDFISRIVHRFGYTQLRRADKGVVLRFLGRVSGYSRAAAHATGRARAQTRSLGQAVSRPAHRFYAHLYRRRCAAARAHRYSARHVVWAGHQEAHGARLSGVW